MLKSRLDFKPVRNTKEIEIDAYSSDPQEAANLANQVARSYKQFRSDEYDALKNGGIKSLEEDLAAQDQKVQLAQAKVDELGKNWALMMRWRTLPILRA